MKRKAVETSLASAKVAPTPPWLSRDPAGIWKPCHILDVECVYRELPRSWYDIVQVRSIALCIIYAGLTSHSGEVTPQLPIVGCLHETMFGWLSSSWQEQRQDSSIMTYSFYINVGGIVVANTKLKLQVGFDNWVCIREETTLMLKGCRAFL